MPEIELLVAELETRIDRLRSLYDMYFMGIERLEPLVPKKDVERRMAQLRKEQIRNTGVRFKFQVIIQRYNTYQTYWLRIARQIEQGTYKRHVMRATARFGIDPMRELPAESPLDAQPDMDELIEIGPAGQSDPPPAMVPEQRVEEVYDLGAFAIAEGLEEDPFAELKPPAPQPRVAPRERFASATRLELGDLADPFEEHDPFPKPLGAPVSAPKIRIAPRPGTGASKAPPAGDPNRDTERRMPVAAKVSGAPAPRALDPADQGPGTVPVAPRVIVQRRASIPDEIERAPAASVPSPPPSQPSVKPTLQRPATLSGTGPAIRPLATTPSRAPAPAVSATPSRAPVAAPATPSRAPAPAPPNAVPTALGSSPVIRRAPPAAQPEPAARPAAPAPAPARVAPPNVGDLSGDRFGEIFSQYVETRRKHNEPTHAITKDALAKQLTDSTSRLKQKHGDKAIDFEVVVKDGKTILRPVVK